MKNYLYTFLLGLALFAINGCSESKKAELSEAQHPNIVLILSDDQSWTDYSFMGHPYIQTPRIDNLASEGITFTRGYTIAPLCRPALASIATGLYPHQHGVLGNDPIFKYEGRKDWGPEWMNARAEADKPNVDGITNAETLADVLKKAGYVSLQTGKWWEGHYSNGGFDAGMTHGDPNRGGRHGDKGLKIGRKGMDIIYNFIDSANADGRPFFIWYAPFLPHNPHNPPDSLRNKYLSLAPSEAVANYWATCEWFDITCGQLIDYVDQKGLSENTLFVYVTDNGWIQDQDRPNRYAPRSKRTPYEMGIRTPITFSWKGTIEPKMDEIHPVSSIDIATTIYAICNLDKPANLQGINVLDDNALQSRKAIYAETYAHDFSSIDSSLYYRTIIDGWDKLILPDVNNKGEELPQLFDLKSDPHEKVNLAEENPARVQELTDKITEWWVIR